MNNSFFIKNGYQINTQLTHYLDSEEEALIYQLDVYAFAQKQLKDRNIRSVLDIGCGLGLKLEKYILPYCSNIVGIDAKHAIAYCKKHHVFGHWYTDDIERPQLQLNQTFDLIISSDVIEHLVNPDCLLHYMQQFAHPQTQLIISTPERDLRRGVDHQGPPGNLAHVREWNQREFSEYLTDRGLIIEEHHIMDLKAGMKTCQTILGQFRG